MSDPTDTRAQDKTTIEPVLLAVLANRMDGIVREMTNTLLRTGRSAILNTARDFSCSIVTADDRLLSAAEGLPIHIVGSDLLTRSMQRFHDDIQEGDAFLHNDPYNGNTHHADHTILVPVFHDGVHLFTAVAKAHQADCGNAEPTTYAAHAKDIYEEGALNFPCVRVQREYQNIDDIIRMCRQRIRVPDQWYGDYLAALGAARIGERRLKELVKRYGPETIRKFCEEWFDYSERRMVQQISALPALTISGSSVHDPMPGLPEGIPVTVELTIRPDEGRIVADLTQNIDAVPNGMNLSEATALSSVIIGICNQLPTQVPHNDGSFRRIEVKLRENSVAGIPRHPTSCSVATTNVADRLINATQAAFAQLGEGFGLAEGALGQGPGFGVVSGRDTRSGDDVPFINQVYFASSGGPGTPDEDGWLFYGIPVAAGLMFRDSVEVAEQKYPIVVDEIRLLADTEGAGTFRGAPGARVSFGPLESPVTVAYTVDGNRRPPAGVRGGQGTVPHDVHLIDHDGSSQELVTVGSVEVKPGQKIVSRTNGGGGYGPPEARDPHRVLDDVRNGFVSADRAREVYRVAVAEDGAGGYSLNTEDTERLRAIRR